MRNVPCPQNPSSMLLEKHSNLIGHAQCRHSPCSKCFVKNLGKCPKNALQLKGDDSVDRNSCKYEPSVCWAGIETRIGVDTNHSLFQSAVDMISFIYDLHYLRSVLPIICFIYDLRYLRSVLSMICAIYDLCFLRLVLSMICVIYDLRFLRSILSMICTILDQFHL
jgi:hypothetical protein